MLTQFKTRIRSRLDRWPGAASVMNFKIEILQFSGIPSFILKCMYELAAWATEELPGKWIKSGGGDFVLEKNQHSVPNKNKVAYIAVQCLHHQSSRASKLDTITSLFLKCMYECGPQWSWQGNGFNVEEEEELLYEFYPEKVKSAGPKVPKSEDVYIAVEPLTGMGDLGKQPIY